MINNAALYCVQYIYPTRPGRREGREDQRQMWVQILVQSRTISHDVSDRCNRATCVRNDGTNLFLRWQRNRPCRIGNIELGYLVVEGELMAQNLALASGTRTESKVDRWSERLELGLG